LNPHDKAVEIDILLLLFELKLYVAALRCALVEYFHAWPPIRQYCCERRAVAGDEFDERVCLVIAHYKVETENSRWVGP